MEGKEFMKQLPLDFDPRPKFSIGDVVYVYDIPSVMDAYDVEELLSNDLPEDLFETETFIICHASKYKEGGKFKYWEYRVKDYHFIFYERELDKY